MQLSDNDEVVGAHHQQPDKQRQRQRQCVLQFAILVYPRSTLHWPSNVVCTKQTCTQESFFYSELLISNIVSPKDYQPPKRSKRAWLLLSTKLGEIYCCICVIYYIWRNILVYLLSLLNVANILLYSDLGL